MHPGSIPPLNVSIVSTSNTQGTQSENLMQCLCNCRVVLHLEEPCRLHLGIQRGGVGGEAGVASSTSATQRARQACASEIPCSPVSSPLAPLPVQLLSAPEDTVLWQCVKCPAPEASLGEHSLPSSARYPLVGTRRQRKLRCGCSTAKRKRFRSPSLTIGA